jgi:hypothetical protein
VLSSGSTPAFIGPILPKMHKISPDWSPQPTPTNQNRSGFGSYIIICDHGNHAYFSPNLYISHIGFAQFLSHFNFLGRDLTHLKLP